MNNYQELLRELEVQEKELQFSEFTSKTALKIGMDLVEKGQKGNKVITIDITRNGHQLFHYSFDGTSPDNDQWVIRKNRVVNRFNMSSYHMSIFLQSEGKTLEEKFLLSSQEYARYGGAFPIIIKNVGAVGTITVSGLTQEEDHAMVVGAIGDFLKGK
jgi:uncharacterized protein (UPF0303 family)